MELRNISMIYKDREVKPLDVRHKFAVIIPLIKIGNELHVIFERRARTLKSQPNEVSFPGGKIEAGELPKEGAIRETMEELNISRENIKVIAETDYLITKDLVAINSFVASIEGVNIEDIKPNKDEVDNIFTVPLDFFLQVEPIKYTLDLNVEYNNEFPYELIPNGKDYDWKKASYSVYFYNYCQQVIWGFTAKMIYSFVKIIRGSE